MDYSKFLDDNFDVKEWVNAAFGSQKDPATSKDHYATTLVMKLQMFIQEVSNIIEESSQQALQNLPRVMREIDAVQQEAALLQDQMRLVKQDIQKVEHDTAQSMQMLLKLDGIKSRMKATANALQEADNWTTLSADVEDVFQSKDVQAITTKLVGMQQSLQMLVDTPDYEDKCQHLEKLKNRLEALLSPQVVAAFNAQSLEATQMYTKIFSDINRLSQLYKYYHKCHKSQLLQQWKTISEANSEESLAEWLTEFYDQLLSTWHAQVKWCSQVFPNSLPIVCDLITETLDSLNPSVGQCVANLLAERGETLYTLIDLKQISERFSKSMDSAIEVHLAGSLGSHERLHLVVYAAYRPYLLKYKMLEDVALSKELNNIKLDHEEVVDSVSLLGASVNKLFAAAKKANERCLQLTNAFGYLFLLDALKTYFSSYCREFKRVLINVREKCRTGHGSVDTEDWSLFQHSLRMIQTCGELIMHTDELDQSIISSMITCLGKYLGPHSPVNVMDKRSEKRKNPFQAQATLFLSNPANISALEAFVIKLEDGDTPSVLLDVRKEMCSLSEEVHRFGFDIVFAQLKRHLTHLGDMEIWTSKSAGTALTSDLPTFSLSPQEYITKIGQYLMTLPQQLEPFTMQDNPAVNVALKHGRLPYTDNQEVVEHSSDLWLESIANGTMNLYSEEILKIHQLSPHGTKQLITDIDGEFSPHVRILNTANKLFEHQAFLKLLLIPNLEDLPDYLCNVLDDLGLHANTMKNIESLLKATPEEYSDIAEHMPQRLTNAISGMRNIEL